jgi:hypothetical protein
LNYTTAGFQLGIKKVTNIHQEIAREAKKKDAETEFLDEIQTNILRVFLFALQSHLYSEIVPFTKAGQLVTGVI